MCPVCICFQEPVSLSRSASHHCCRGVPACVRPSKGLVSSTNYQRCLHAHRVIRASMYHLLITDVCLHMLIIGICWLLIFVQKSFFAGGRGS